VQHSVPLCRRYSQELGRGAHENTSGQKEEPLVDFGFTKVAENEKAKLGMDGTISFAYRNNKREFHYYFIISLGEGLFGLCTVVRWLTLSVKGLKQSAPTEQLQTVEISECRKLKE
jgi:hypothetical protein